MSLPPHIPSDPDEARRRAAADPLLASVMGAADAAGVGDCLDVETLGLYADRALRGAALANARAHIERCERCRSIVAFVDQAERDAVAASAGRGVWGWLTGWRWLVPAASVAAVAVIAVWVNRGPANDAAAPAAPVTPEAAVAATPAPNATLQAPAAPSAPRDGLAGGVLSTPAPPAAPARARANAVPADQVAGRETAALASEKVAADAATRQAASAGNAASVAETARAPEVESQRPADVRMAAPREVVGGLTGGTRPAPQSREAAAPTPATTDARAEAAARPAPAAARVADEPQGQARRMDDVAAATRADTATAGWRVRDGAVERQRAGVWQRVTTPDGVAVIAVASPSRDVCWAIGASDILRTWNGDTWTRVALPETSEPLRAVTATDASTAVVTTTSGVRFRTSNGGATWTRL